MVQGVVVTSFIAVSNASKEVLKTATLLKTLNVNTLITGDTGVGKKTLAQYILPHAPIIDASSNDELITNLESNSSIIITNIQNSPNIITMIESIKKNNVRVIATAKYTPQKRELEELFTVKFDIPLLENRKEDVEELINIFTQEAFYLFGGKNILNKENFIPDLSENSHSLKRQVMIKYLLQDLQDSELMSIIENYLINKIGSNNDYKDFLYLYEAPLIKAGLKRFKSQLQLSDKLGLNRNTLRKKIADNKKYL